MNNIKKKYTIKPILMKEARRRSIPMLALLCLLMGVWAITIYLDSFDGLLFNLATVIAVTTIECIILHYTYKFSMEVTYFIIGSLFIGIEVALYFNWSDVLKEMASMVYGFQTGISDTRDITGIIVVIMMLMTFVVFALEYFLNNHLLFWLFTTMIVVLLPILGSDIPMIAVIFTVLFQFGFLALQSPTPRNKQEIMAMPKKMKISIQSTLILFGIAVLAGLVATPFTLINSDNIFNTLKYTENIMLNYFGKIGNQDSMIDGSISRGNLYQTGETRLHVVCNKILNEPLYIRCFEGKDYKDGKWSKADDKELLINLEGYKHKSLDEIYNDYTELYYNTNRLLCANESVLVSINAVRGVTNDKFVPYYSKLDKNNRDEVFKYRYYRFEQDKMEIANINEMIKSIDKELDFAEYEEYLAIETEYKRNLQYNYLDVPYEDLPRLSALVESYPQDGLDNISAFIIYTIHSTVEYTLNPGWSALGMDIAEDFLFNRQKGYCSHYALVATLMYRMYGIPARYVSGYSIDPSNYVDITNKYGETLHYYNVTDKSAHAWVEIFLDGYGWVPVDVTPDENGLVAISYPGFNKEKFDAIVSENNWEELDTVNEIVNKTDDDADKNKIDATMTFRITELVMIIVCMAFVVNITCRKYMNRKANSRQLFYNLIDALHTAGIMREYTGNEIDFAKKLSLEVEGINEGVTDNIIEKLNKLAYSNEKSDIYRDDTREYYRNCINNLYNRLDIRKKLIFKLVKLY